MTFSRPFYRWRPHPWHGLEVGPSPPRLVNAYIEMTPFDYVKYEVDKATGYLWIDRPQRTSSQPPTLYGFIPKTYCAEEVARLSPEARAGDGDPLDVCVVSERPINRSEIFVHARVIGGLQIVDNEEADDKIVAVLENDYFWGDVEQLEELPDTLVERLEHYFSTYKMRPDEPAPLEVVGRYDAAHAREVVEASITDYQNHRTEG